MNKAFTKTNKIELDDKHFIQSDGDNGIELIFHEMRERKSKTGEKEQFLYTEPRYFTRLTQSLTYFIDKTQNESKTLEELSSKVDYNTKLLERLDREFKQFD